MAGRGDCYANRSTTGVPLVHASGVPDRPFLGTDPEWRDRVLERSRAFWDWFDDSRGVDRLEAGRAAGLSRDDRARFL